MDFDPSNCGVSGGSPLKQRKTGLGAEIARIRDSQDLTIRQLAKMAGLNRCYLSEVELGRKIPSVKTIEQIAQALQVNRNLLLKHIGLLKMDFTRPAQRQTFSELAQDLTEEDMQRLSDYARYLRYQREVGSPATSSKVG